MCSRRRALTGKQHEPVLKGGEFNSGAWGMSGSPISWADRSGRTVNVGGWREQAGG